MLVLAVVTGMATAILGISPGVASASLARHAGPSVGRVPAGLRAAVAKALGVNAWGEQQELLASNGAADDYFGHAVAISGSTAVVGAYVKKSYTGAVYVFTRSAGHWSQQAELLPSKPHANEQFGYAVAITGSTVVVGAPGTASDKGAAYVFSHTTTGWKQKAMLKASNGVSNDFFGDSVAISGSTVVVGADHGNSSTGAAYVYLHSTTGWKQQAELTASGAAFFDAVGVSVAISGNTAVVGATGTNTGAGAAYVFTRSGTTWSQQAKLSDPVGTTQDDFGQSVAISGSTAVIGAPGTSSNAGAAYVYAGSGGTWTQQAAIDDPGATAGDQFGWSVAMSGASTAVVGSPMNNPSTGDGVAYIYTGTGGTWTEQAEVGAGGVGSDMGISVAISKSTLIAGADFTNSATGAAFVFVNG